MATTSLPDVSGVISAPRLEGLLNSFDPFETKMQEGTKARLLKDKLKVEAMARETDRLTNALSSQVQIRRQMNEQLQRFCEGKLDTCYTEYDALVLDQTTRVEERLEALDERITALDEHFQAEKERIKQEIEERHKELMEMLEKFHQLFEAECTVRAEREAAIKAEMAEHEKEVGGRFDVEKVAREEVIKILRQELEENITSRRTSDKHFAAFVEAELKVIKQTLAAESQIREQEDDEIEAALSRYTNKLQSSLHIINSTDA